MLKESERALKMCKTGEPILCGDKIRLEHNLTGKNLHSHNTHRAALSGGQEVTAYGSDGYGDGADDWKIECFVESKSWWGGSTEGEGKVFGKTKFYLQHIDTGKYLDA